MVPFAEITPEGMMYLVQLPPKQTKALRWSPTLDLKILNLQIAKSIWGNTCFEMIFSSISWAKNLPPSRSKRSFGHHVDRQSRRICEFDPNCKSHTWDTICMWKMHDMWRFAYCLFLDLDIYTNSWVIILRSWWYMRLWYILYNTINICAINILS